MAPPPGVSVCIPRGASRSLRQTDPGLQTLGRFLPRLVFGVILCFALVFPVQIWPCLAQAALC